MKKRLCRSACLLLLIFLQLSTLGQGTDPVAAQASRKPLYLPNAQSLRVLLKRVHQERQINFIYSEEVVEGKVVKKTNRNFSTLADQLTFILASLGLTFTNIDDHNYVIRVVSPSTLAAHSSESDEMRSPSATTTLRGRVVDGKDGSRLPGVNVVVRESTVGNVTDTHGNYAIPVPTNATTLVFSSVGYQTQEVAISRQSVIDVQLEPAVTALEEVVVVGYGSQARKDMTGAVDLLDAQRIEGGCSSSFEPLVAGRVAGLQVLQNSGQPGGSISMRIRGVNSINASSEPLYIVDGVPVNGYVPDEIIGFSWAGGGGGQTAIDALSFLNPDDIASLSLLKDASATAIYGARGANGVVLITTKRGETGKAQVQMSASYGFQQVQKRLEVMNLPQYTAYQRELETAGWLGASGYAAGGTRGAGTDWQREIFCTAPVQNYQVSATGGSDRTQYALSGGYFHQSGIVIGSGFRRYALRLNADHRVRPWLKLGNSLLLSRTSEQVTLNDATDGVISQAWRTAPNVAVRHADGSFAGPPARLAGQTNPVAQALVRDLDVLRNRLLGNVYAEATLSPGLTWRTEVGGDLKSASNYAVQPTYQWGATVNEVSQSQRRASTNLFWIVKQYLTYRRTLAQEHRFTLLAGQEMQEDNWKGTIAIRQNFPDHTTPPTSPGEVEVTNNSRWKGSNALVSYFGRLNYDFDDRYLLTATLRADGSSKFGPEHKWGIFPSFAVAWKVHHEDFITNNIGSSISELKLRAGYGEVGNQDIENYAYGTSLLPTATGLGTGYRLSNFPNPGVKWEATTQMNLGVNLGLWDNRVNLGVDVYRKRVKDMLIRQPLPSYLGTNAITEPWVNRGELENRGVELTLSTTNISRRSFSWTSGFTLAHNRNRLTSLGGAEVIARNVPWLNTIRTQVGQPLGQFYGYVVDGLFMDANQIQQSAKQSDKIDRFAGVWPGDIRFKNLNTTPDNGQQVINAADRTYIGDPNPDLVVGFTNSLAYRNLELTVLLQGTYGNDIYNYSRVLTEGMRQPGDNQLVTVFHRARAVKIDPTGEDEVANYRVINPEAILPRAVPADPNNNTRVSDRYVEDGSYLRIQQLSLGYTLPETALSRLGISQLRLSATIQNLLTVTRYSGLDPAVGAYNQNPLLQGIDNGRYPIPRTITLGVNVTL